MEEICRELRIDHWKDGKFARHERVREPETPVEKFIGVPIIDV